TVSPLLSWSSPVSRLWSTQGTDPRLSGRSSSSETTRGMVRRCIGWGKDRVVEWSNVTWFLTALGAVVVLLTRVRLGATVVDGTGHGAGRHGYSATLLRLHTIVGVITLIGWVVALVTGRREIALLMLAGWWLLTIVGLLLLAR